MNGAAGFWIGFFFLCAVEEYCESWKAVERIKKGVKEAKRRFWLWRIFDEITPNKK